MDTENFACNDINPLDILVTMQGKNSESLIPKGMKIKNYQYSNKRNGIINALRRLNNKQKFSQKAIYHAILYSDQILHNNTDVKIDLTAICCLLLAGK